MRPCKSMKLDALVAPAFPPAITIDLVNGDAEIGGDATTAPAIAGYPIISVPMGLVHGLPVGFAVVGAAEQRADTATYRTRGREWRRTARRRRAEPALYALAAVVKLAGCFGNRA